MLVRLVATHQRARPQRPETNGRASSEHEAVRILVAHSHQVSTLIADQLKITGRSAHTEARRTA